MRGNVKEKSGYIFYRLLVPVLAMVVSVSLILIISSYGVSKKFIREKTHENFIRIAEDIDNFFQYHISESLVKDINLLASNSDLIKYISASELEKYIYRSKVETLFRKFIDYAPEYQNIYFVDYTGKEKIRVDRTGSIRAYRDLSRDKLFIQIETDALNDINVTAPYRSSAGESIFSIGINVFDQDTGLVGGAVIIDYSLERFIEYLDSTELWYENPVWLFSSSGDILRRPVNVKSDFNPYLSLPREIENSPRLDVLKQGVLIFQDLFIIPSRPLLRVAVYSPFSLLYKDIKMLLKFLVAMFFASVSSMFIIAVYFSKSISGPITKLAEAADSLAKGDLKSRAIVKDSGEIQTVVNSFNKLAINLHRVTAAKEYLDNVIDNIADILIILDQRGNVTRMNQPGLDLLGYNIEELIGKPANSFIKNLVFESIEWNEFLEGKELKDHEVIFSTKSKEDVLVSLSASNIKDENSNPTGFVIIARDIRKAKQYQENLIKSEKIGSVGLLADGIARDMSNYLSLALDGISGMEIITSQRWNELQPDDLKEFLDSSKEALRRCKGINQLLFDFSGSQGGELQMIYINEVIESAINKLDSDISLKNITIQKDLQPSLPLFSGDYLLIQRAVYNILSNAKWAIDKNAGKREGIITIKTRHDQLNSCLLISISDTGIGISKENLARIFEPFFTTKSQREGLGLGLTLVYNIIKRHRGKIEVESTVGKGSTFKITLPV